jgi:hypothetical protein
MSFYPGSIEVALPLNAILKCKYLAIIVKFLPKRYY